jgi:hypothetical protein
VGGHGHRDFLVKKRVYDAIREQLRIDRKAEDEEADAGAEAETADPMLH